MKLTKKKLKEIRAVLGSNARIKKASEKKPKPQRKVSSVLKSKKSKRHDMNRSEWEACGKKTRYASQHEARQIANNCERLRPETKLRVYWCPFCDGWHVTSQELRQRRNHQSTALTRKEIVEKEEEKKKKEQLTLKKEKEEKKKLTEAIRRRRILNEKIHTAAKQVASILGI